jgi:hypothetical protein
MGVSCVLCSSIINYTISMHSSRAYFATYVYVYHALYEPQRNGDQLELSHDMNIKMATK